MRSPFASLRTLVLPFGATTGPRIVLNGIDGVIEVYDAAGLFARIDTTDGFIAVSGDQYMRINVDPDDVPVLAMSTGDAAEDAFAFLNTRVLGAGGTRNLRSTLSSGNFTGETSARIFLRSESQDGTEPSQVHIDATELAVNASVCKTISDTTDASGNVTFAHGAGTTPKGVFVCHQSPIPGSQLIGVDTIGATTARARFDIGLTAVVFRALTIV